MLALLVNFINTIIALKILHSKVYISTYYFPVLLKKLVTKDILTD